MPGQTLFDKIWDRHVITDLGDGYALLHISRHLMHDGGGRGLQADQGRRLPRAQSATSPSPPSTMSSRPSPAAPHETLKPLRSGSITCATRPRLGHQAVRPRPARPRHRPRHRARSRASPCPARLLVCGDSHTCTHGGMGALAFGVGATEVIHVLATQIMVQRKPKRMRVTFEGKRRRGRHAQGHDPAPDRPDRRRRRHGLCRRICRQRRSAPWRSKAGSRSAISRSSSAPRSAWWRPTTPPSSSSKAAPCAQGRAVGPGRRRLAHAAPAMPTPCSTPRCTIDVNKIAPQITWGTSPEHVIAVDRRDPRSGHGRDPDKQKALQAALDYMGLEAGTPIQETKVDWVFIGSCTNSRISDLRAAAADRQGPQGGGPCARLGRAGLGERQAQAEAEGLDRVFLDAGFEWREPGCSMCLAVNGDTSPPGAAQRLDLQPQLRRPPGAGRAHPSRQSRRWPRPPPSPAASPTSRTIGVRSESGDRPWKPSPCSMPGGAADAAERQHRHHHPDRAAGATSAQAELGPYAFEPLALPARRQREPRLRPATSRPIAGRRSSSPTTTSPAARAARARCGR